MKNNQFLDNVLNNLLNPHEELFITGFRDIDNTIVGIPKGTLITVGGRPAMGKTTFLMSILEMALKNNKKCLYFSFAVSKETFIRKLLIQMAELNSIIIRLGNISDIEKEKLSQSMKDLKNCDFELSCEISSIEDIEEKISSYKPDYVFIDYIQLIKVNSKKGLQSEIQYIFQQLKKIATEYACHIFIASQLSRNVEYRTDKRPLLCDLRESGVIEEVSDVVLFIYREEYYQNFEEQDTNNYAEIIIPKNNCGLNGTIYLNFKKQIPKFSSI